MKTFIALSLLTFSAQSFSASMNLQGTCSGTYANGTPVSFEYFSNFDGCKEVSRAAVSFSSGTEGLLTGTRSFTRGKDIYSLHRDSVRLTFADSTGNVGGFMTYTNENNERRTIPIQCETRDYEYADCN